MKKEKHSVFFVMLFFTVILIIINSVVNLIINHSLKNNFYIQSLKKNMTQQAEFISKYVTETGEIDDTIALQEISFEYFVFNTIEGEITASSNKNIKNTQYNKSESFDRMTMIMEKTDEGFLDYEKYPLQHKALNLLINDSSNNYFFIEEIHPKGIFIVVYVRQPQVFKLLEISTQYQFLCMFATILICFPICLFISSKVQNMIERIKEYTESIAIHSFDTQTPVFSIREFEEMTESLETMGHSIQKDLEDLHKKTLALNKALQETQQFEEKQKIFVSDVSHEIKTPISIIRGYVEGLQMDIVETNEDRQEYYSIIIDECDRMTALVKQLLTLSKMEQSKLSMQFQQYDIIPVLKNIREKFDRKCAEYDVEVSLETDELSLFVDADPSIVENVIINYMQNAYKYCSKPGWITIEAIVTSEGILIGVKNKGPQIPEQMHEKIWERFFKIDIARTRNETSTGLGLSIVKTMMEQHGSPYGVKNIEDGVEFYIILTPSFRNKQ